MSDTDRTARLESLVDLAYEVAEVAGHSGDEPGAEDPAEIVLAEVAALNDGAAVVVCVGEKKRGKSSLINALIGRPGLLPVDADVASGVHVLVRHGEVPEAVVHRGTAGAAPDGVPAAESVPLERVAEYAGLDPESQRPRHPDVDHLDIAIPADVLRPGLVLVDTPGVGGLVAGHARLTMATLRRADALLFVVDASGELTRSELAFLERATERIATVVFVLTKTDLYPHWRDVLERDRALVAEHAPRYARAPWFAVSSALEEDALEAERSGDTETAARRRTAAGCRELGTALGRMIAERAEDVRAANAARVVRGVLDPLAAQVLRTLEVASGRPAATEEVERLQQALAREKSATANWRMSLNSRMNRLERDVRLHFRRGVNDLRAAAEDQIATADGAATLAALPDSLEQAVRAAWLDLESTLGEQLRKIVQDTASEIDSALGHDDGEDSGGAGHGSFGLPLPDRLRDPKRPAPAAHDQRGPVAFVERLMPSWGAGMLTFGIATFVTGGLLAPAAVGAGVMGVLVSRRRRRAELIRERADAQRYVTRLVGELETEVPPLVKGVVEEVRERLTGMIVLGLERREGELRAELKEHRAVLAREKRERDLLAAAARSRYELIAGLIDRLEALAPEAGPTGRAGR